MEVRRGYRRYHRYHKRYRQDRFNNRSSSKKKEELHQVFYKKDKQRCEL